MAKAAQGGGKKSKADISKAANQKKKVATKVFYSPFRNGPRERSRKNLIMLSSSTKLLTIKLLQLFPKSEDIFQQLT